VSQKKKGKRRKGGKTSGTSWKQGKKGETPYKNKKRKEGRTAEAFIRGCGGEKGLGFVPFNCTKGEKEGGGKKSRGKRRDGPSIRPVLTIPMKERGHRVAHSNRFFLFNRPGDGQEGRGKGGRAGL